MKKLYYLPILLLTLSFGAVSCTGDDESLLSATEWPQPQKAPGDTDDTPGEGDYDGIPDAKAFSIDVESVEDAPAAGQTYTVTVTAEQTIEWTASSEQTWLMQAPVTGTGNGTFDIVVEATGGLGRTGSVTVKTLSEEVETPEFTIPANQLSGADIPVLDYSIASLTNVEDPGVAEENGVYYVFSSNMALAPATYEPGLMLRTSTDLVNYTFKGYVLSNVYNAAKASLLAIAPGLAPETIRMAAPYIVKVGSEWRLYYTIMSGYFNWDDFFVGGAAIGWASTASLEDQQWVDHGLILSCNGGAYATAYPAFIAVNGRHYLSYGLGGVKIIELNTTTGKTLGAATILSADMASSKPNIVNMNGTFILVLDGWQPWNASTIRAASSTSGAVTGPYDSFGRTNWVIANVLVAPNLMPKTTSYFGFRHSGSASFIQKGGEWYMLHHAQAGTTLVDEASDNVFRLQTRKVGFTSNGYPSVSLEVYAGESQTMTQSELVGMWLYTTVWGYQFDIAGTFGQYNFRLYDQFTLLADNTFTGRAETGTWAFNAQTNELTLSNVVWVAAGSPETIRLIVSKAGNSDNLDGTGFATRYSGHGYNCSFGEHPAVLMRKVNAF